MSIVKQIRAGEPASTVSYQTLSLHELKSSVTALSSKLLIIHSMWGRRHSGIMCPDKTEMMIYDKVWQRRAGVHATGTQQADLNNTRRQVFRTT